MRIIIVLFTQVVPLDHDSSAPTPYMQNKVPNWMDDVQI